MNQPNVLSTEMSSPRDRRAISTSTVAVPAHVVFRTFASETLALNLETGLYHSLNSTGGRILEVLAECGQVEAAVERLIAEYDCPADQLADGVCDYCSQLVEHGLLELDPSA